MRESGFGYWRRAQAAFDTEIAEDAYSETLNKIKPRREQSVSC
jgi:hypothetical protein